MEDVSKKELSIKDKIGFKTFELKNILNNKDKAPIYGVPARRLIMINDCVISKDENINSSDFEELQNLYNFFDNIKKLPNDNILIPSLLDTFSDMLSTQEIKWSEKYGTRLYEEQVMEEKKSRVQRFERIDENAYFLPIEIIQNKKQNMKYILSHLSEILSKFTTDYSQDKQFITDFIDNIRSFDDLLKIDQLLDALELFVKTVYLEANGKIQENSCEKTYANYKGLLDGIKIEYNIDDGKVF